MESRKPVLTSTWLVKPSLERFRSILLQSNRARPCIGRLVWSQLSVMIQHEINQDLEDFLLIFIGSLMHWSVSRVVVNLKQVKLVRLGFQVLLEIFVC